MLPIIIPNGEMYDESQNRFIKISKPISISLEHSLLSISKWESKWHKPFFGKDKKSYEEIIDYIRCMTLTQNIDPRAYYCIPKEELDKINSYIEDPMTATWFSNKKESKTKRIITSEIIYYWMISFGIPFECQKWHINHLLTLIEVCSEESKPKDKKTKMTSSDLAERRRLNEMRKKMLHTRG